MEKVVFIGKDSLNLTQGKVYNVIHQIPEWLIITADNGKNVRLLKSQFKSLEELRDEKIEQILNS